MLEKKDLLSLEDYARKRDAFRQHIMKIKKNRQLSLGEHVRLMFENRATIHYQIQEVLRIEKIFEPAEIQAELDVYNPLIPTGHNLKATLMLEYPDVVMRKQALAKLIGIERCLYLTVDGLSQVRPICNEDLERETEEKTSAVHFMRLELNTQMIRCFITQKPVELGIDHPHYQAKVILPKNIQQALAEDFSTHLA